MILFLKDFAKYPGAVVHLETRNRSFIEHARLLKTMNIKNYFFHLALINPRLVGVNPHDDNLSDAFERMIAVECKMNPWYFFREVLLLPVPGSPEPVMIDANRGNIAAWWLFFNHITFFLIQIRQTGKTVSINSLMVLLLEIMCYDTGINLLTKDSHLRSETVDSVKKISDLLPAWLRQRTSADVANTEQIKIKANLNRYNGHVPQKNERDALNAARGFTSPILHGDEIPFQPNVWISLPAALATGVAARNIARENGTPYGSIFTTTAGKKDSREGAYVYRLLSDACIYHEKLLDCENLAHLEDVVRKASRSDDLGSIGDSVDARGALRVNITMNHRQLGKTDEWLRQAIEETGAVGEDADRDFGNLWTSGSLEHPLESRVLDELKKSVIDPVYIEISPINNFTTRWYVREDQIASRMASGFYILCIDTSDASGGDDISLILLDSKTGELVAAGTYNESNIIKLAEFFASWFTRFENFVAIIERKSSGPSIIDYLLLILPTHRIDPFKRLFNRIVNETDTHREAWKEINYGSNRTRPEVINRYKRSFGFSTAGSGLYDRKQLYGDVLQTAMKLSATQIRDRTTVDQILTLERRNGRVDHMKGQHDDMVIALLLGFWILIHGKNLDHYGISTQTIFSKTKQLTAESPKEVRMRQEQEIVKEQMDILVEQIRAERDDYVIERLEQQIRVLNHRLVNTGHEIVSIDEFIRNLRESKRQEVYRKNPWTPQQQEKYIDQNSYIQGGIADYWAGKR